MFINQTKAGDEKQVIEYAEGVTSHNPELFIQEKQPDRKSIIQSWSDTQSAEILAVGKHHVSARECSLMYIPLKIYTLVRRLKKCVKIARVCKERIVCVSVQLGRDYYVHCLVLVWRADGLSSGQPVDSRGHMGVVTSRQRYANPLVECDEVRLPNPRKTKVLSVRLDKSSATAAWENFAVVHAALHLWDIDDRKSLRLFTVLLMVSKCPPVKMDYVFS